MFFLKNFRGNYSFLNLEIVPNSNSCRNISILYMINTISAAETIQGRKLYEEYSIQMVQLKKKLIIFPSKKTRLLLNQCTDLIIKLLLTTEQAKGLRQQKALALSVVYI